MASIAIVKSDITDFEIEIIEFDSDEALLFYLFAEAGDPDDS